MLPNFLSKTGYNAQVNPKPGMAHALLLLLISGALALIVNPLVLIITQLLPALNVWQMVLSYSFIYGLLLVIALKIWGFKTFEIKKVPLLVMALLLPAIPAMALLSEGITSLIPMPDWIAKLFEDLIQFNLPGFVAVGIMAPVLEELIFRGVILRGFFKTILIDKGHCIFGPYIWFGPINPWQFIPATLIGMAIGWLYFKTQSIWPGLFIHVINNGFSFYLGYHFANVHISFFDIAGSIWLYLVLIIISLLVCWVVYFLLKRYFNQLVQHP